MEQCVKKDFRDLQKKHLEILQYVDSFCRENEIDYCLAYGSALGAKRHGGPIPWDDDADIYMTAAGYDRFRGLFLEKGDRDRFYIQQMQSIDGMVGFAKIRMNGTTYIQDIYKEDDMHQGIYVDIFLLHEAPATALGRLSCVLATSYRTLKEMANTNYAKRKIVKPITAVLNLFPRKFGLKTAYRQLYRWDDTPSDSYAEWEFYTGNPRWYLKKDLIFPAQRMDYDGVSLCVPRQIEKYLEQCYGNWQQIPSDDKIAWCQHALICDTEKDFREYLPNIKDFKDEGF